MTLFDKFAGQLGAIAAAAFISAVTIMSTVSAGPAYAAPFIA